MAPLFRLYSRGRSELTALVIVLFFVLLTVMLSARHLGYDPRGLLVIASSLNKPQCLSSGDNSKELGRRGDLNESERSFFFIETAGASCISDRAACAIESAALRNPDYTVWLLTILDMRDCRFLDNLLYLPNFRTLKIELNQLVKDSVLVHWYIKDDWIRSPFRINHMSDALRMLILWKYGGVYADLDVLILKSFGQLRNVVAREHFPDVGNSVMVFERKHPFLLRCLEEFSWTYKSHKWAYNGPRLLERVLAWFCPRNLLGKLPLVQCSGVTVLPNTAFYPVSYLQWRKTFLRNSTVDVMRTTTESYAIHLWNSYSRSTKTERGSAYDVLRKALCPKTYGLLKKQDLL